MERMYTQNAPLFFVSAILLSAHGGDSPTTAPPAAEGSGLLKQVASAAELEAVKYDVSSPGAPTPDTEIEIEGGFVDSRKIGNTIHFVTRHAFHVDGIELLVNSATARVTSQAILESLTLDDMLPKIRINDEVSILIDPVDCFVSNDDGAAGSPIITSVTAVSIDNPGAHLTVCYNEESNGVYMSEDSLYLTPPDDDFRQTRVHKFGLPALALAITALRRLRAMCGWVASSIFA